MLYLVLPLLIRFILGLRVLHENTENSDEAD
jgi:hypothetical protein